MPATTLYQPNMMDIHRIHTQQTAHTQQTNPQSEHSLSSDVEYYDATDVKLVLNFTPHEIKLVRTTWKDMLSDDLNKDNNGSSHSSIASSLFCIQFYSNLLVMEPELEKMFPSIKHQAVSFAGVLSTAIMNLESLHVLDDYLNTLGKRHARILGIDPPHFELMGIALLKTFNDRYGVNFTLELERCWARLYTYLANSILQFGIDPVLKVDKVNSDLSVLERSSSELTRGNDSLFDQRSVSTASTQIISGSPVIPDSSTKNAPPISTPTANTKRAPVVQSTIQQGKTSLKEMKMGKRISSRNFASSSANKGDDKDCVIM